MNFVLYCDQLSLERGQGLTASEPLGLDRGQTINQCHPGDLDQGMDETLRSR
jgi:hypothetical protein